MLARLRGFGRSTVAQGNVCLLCMPHIRSRPGVVLPTALLGLGIITGAIVCLPKITGLQCCCLRRPCLQRHNLMTLFLSWPILLR